MVIRKIVVCTVCALAVFAAVGCADGTGKALTPVLPTPVSATSSNPDGTLLKVSAPQPAAPRSATRVSNLTPTLRLTNASAEFDNSAVLAYVFEVYDEATLIATSDPVTAFGSETTWTVPSNVLTLNKVYSWRGRAVYNGVAGSWSDSAAFQTPLPAPVDGPVPCGSSAGLDIVRCVGAAYPAYLVATERGDNSLQRRQHNMEFIRDRIIETGRCKGLDLARNFKRGTPVISHDFIVWRSNVGKGGRDRGVDIATGYDDVKQPLRIKWQVFDKDEDWGHPYYAAYGPVDCSGI
jgi:hypothetical protein